MPSESKSPSFPEYPYRGLAYYDSDDVSLFSEREEEAAEAAALLGLPSTRLLLLHGLSGVGKSSFVRAGLIPEICLRDNDFVCPRTAEESFDLIRCTEDPLLELCKSLRLWCSPTNAALPNFAASIKAKCLAHLAELGDHSTKLDYIAALTKVLLDLTATATRTLVIVIDQAEEVITLATEKDPLHRKDAFFDFLLNLCSLHLDLKVIVSLRTEYYGQFCAAFGLDPSERSLLAESRPHIGRASSKTSGWPAAFLLQPIRTREKLRRMILRPTGRGAIPPYGVPHKHYGFEYEPAVVEALLEELLSKTSTISTLPLLQAACRTLYEHRERNDLISMSDYKRLGGVEGTVSAYIDTALTSAIDQAKATEYAVPGRIAKVLKAGLLKLRGFFIVGTPTERWREVLCGLVGQSEGGAVTTRIQDEASLVKKASTIGVSRENTARSVLRALSKGRWMILRSVGAGTDLRYSLSHDSIAAVLDRWRLGFEEVLRIARIKRNILATTGIFLVAYIGYLAYFQFHLPRQLLNNATLALEQHINSTEKPPFGSDLPTYASVRNVLAALEKRNAALAGVISSDKAKLQLESFNNRAPDVNRRAFVVGVNSDASLVAFLSRATGPSKRLQFSVETFDVSKGTSNQLGRFDVSDDRASSTPPAIGFLRGQSTPIAYWAGWTYALKDGAWIAIDHLASNANEAGATKSTELVANRSDSSDVLIYAFPEVTEDGVRLTTFTGRARSASLLGEQFANASLTPVSMSADSFDRRFPTISAGSNFYTSLNVAREHQLTAASSSAVTGLEIVVRSLLDNKQSWRKVVLGQRFETEPVVAVGYNQDRSAVVVRPDSFSLVLIENEFVEAPRRRASDPVRYTVPEAAAAAPLRTVTWERPAIASFISNEKTLFAWPVDRGVMLLEGGSLDEPSPKIKRAKVLLDGSSSSQFGVPRLQFSSRGEHLIETIQSFGQPAQLKIWKLNNDYAQRLNLEAVHARACKLIEGFSPPTTARRDAAPLVLEGETLPDPCNPKASPQ